MYQYYECVKVLSCQQEGTLFPPGTPPELNKMLTCLGWQFVVNHKHQRHAHQQYLKQTLCNPFV